mmetsp:Transcript_44464/g.145765  ORF Transcript_44464/g.145765 Transcript_44464/m.145765 type:complete len:404 (+) Transcript_44464:563-1774(+)
MKPTHICTQAQYPTASSLRVGGRAEGGRAPKAAPHAAQNVSRQRPAPANLSRSRAIPSGERTRTLTRRRVGAHTRTRAITRARQRGEACARLARASNPKPAAAMKAAGLVVSSSARRAANITKRASESWTGLLCTTSRRSEMRTAGGEGGMEGGGTLAAGVGRVCSSGGVAEPERSRSSMGLPPPKCHVISPGPGGGGAPASASGPRASEISARKGSRPASNPDPDASPACAAAANPSTRPSADAVRASGVSRSGGGAGKRGIATADGRATLLLSVRPTEKATPPPEVDSAAASARPGSGPGSSSLRITSVGPGQSDVWFTTRCAGKREDGDGSFQKPSPWRLAISSEPSPTGTHTLDAGTNTPCFRQRPQNLSRKAALDACGGSASQPSAPPETTSPQHVSV